MEEDWLQWTSLSTPRFSLAGRDLRARLLDVHDGDTLTAAIEVFPGQVFSFAVRLDGIDAPEMTDPDRKTIAEAARVRLVQLLVPSLATTVRCDDGQKKRLTRAEMRRVLQGNVHMIRLRCTGMDKYGRVLARVGDNNVEQQLIVEGLAVEYRAAHRPASGQNKLS